VPVSGRRSILGREPDALAADEGLHQWSLVDCSGVASIEHGLRVSFGADVGNQSLLTEGERIAIERYYAHDGWYEWSIAWTLRREDTTLGAGANDGPYQVVSDFFAPLEIGTGAESCSPRDPGCGGLSWPGELYVSWESDEVVVANGSSASIGSWAVELLSGSVAQGVQCGYYSGWRRYSFAILRAG